MARETFGRWLLPPHIKRNNLLSAVAEKGQKGSIDQAELVIHFWARHSTYFGND